MPRNIQKGQEGHNQEGHNQVYSCHSSRKMQDLPQDIPRDRDMMTWLSTGKRKTMNNQHLMRFANTNQIPRDAMGILEFETACRWPFGLHHSKQIYQLRLTKPPGLLRIHPRFMDWIEKHGNKNLEEKHGKTSWGHKPFLEIGRRVCDSHTSRIIKDSILDKCWL